VSEYYAQNGSFPTTSTTASTGAAKAVSVSGASGGKYVSSISVVSGGEIVVNYGGNQTNAKLSGLQLTLNPGLDANYDVVWVCGSAATPSTVSTLPAGTSTTSIPASYLPTSCHT
jgi:putative lipase involved disintegration of autophagic bodies